MQQRESLWPTQKGFRCPFAINPLSADVVYTRHLWVKIPLFLLWTISLDTKRILCFFNFIAFLDSTWNLQSNSIQITTIWTKIEQNIYLWYWRIYFFCFFFIYFENGPAQKRLTILLKKYLKACSVKLLRLLGSAGAS